MYKFIFYFIYKGQLKDNKGAIDPSKNMAWGFVTIAVGCHLLFVYSLARFGLFHFISLPVLFTIGRHFHK